MRLSGEGALTSASPGVGSRLPAIVRLPGEVVISMRPVSVFANGPATQIEQLQADLHGQQPGWPTGPVWAAPAGRAAADRADRCFSS